MTVTRTVELSGHIIDSGMMERAFGVVMDMGGSFHVEQFDVGTRKDETSYCRMAVSAESEAALAPILHDLRQAGATVAGTGDAAVERAPADRVPPRGFYSTTNHPTDVRIDGEWVAVEGIEMDCVVVVEDGRTGEGDGGGADGTETGGSDADGRPADRPADAGDGGGDADGHPADAGGGGGEDADGPRAVARVLGAVAAGDRVVTGEEGIRVRPPERPRDAGGPFGFMQSGVSSERPSQSLVESIAEAVVATRRDGGTVLVVPGPAVVHTGAGPDLARLVRAGYVDALSAGNGFAVHDLEHARYGTSLGMDVETLDHPRRGHRHHLDTIAEVIRAGGIEAAVEDGLVDSGVMYQCVENDVPYVLAGSVRDDGPLPDTMTDAVEAQAAIRDQAQEADLVVMLATLLHSVAVGNCLPSTTPTVCVDIDSATVTQLLDRGSAQATGMVTDVGMFLPRLADAVLDDGDADTRAGEGGDGPHGHGPGGRGHGH